MIIVSAADEKFAPHFATMLHSAWTLHPDAEYYLIDCGLQLATLGKLVVFAQDNKINLTIRHLSERHLKDVPTTKYWTVAVYARLLIPYMLLDAKRAIYLDADTVVTGSLSELWQTDMQGCPVAGVRDAVHPKRGPIRDYINAGVLLMDLVQWREGKISEWCIAYAVKVRPEMLDQDAINATCRGHIHIVPGKWNFLIGDNVRFPPEDPRIVHYTGPEKPWFFRDALCGSIYLFHRQQTPFPLDTPPRVWRSFPRMAINLAIGRPKYWRRLRRQVACRPFVLSYLGSVVA